MCPTWFCFGPDPVYSLHCWYSQSRRTAWFPPTPVRWWYTGIWPVQIICCHQLPVAYVCVCRWRHSAAWILANRLQLNTAGLRRFDQSPTHTPVSTGWRSRSVFSSSWRQWSIVYWTVRLLATWLQICAVCLTPSRRRLRSSLTNQLDVRQSQCSTVGDWVFTVAGARLTSSEVTDCHSSAVKSKLFIRTVISLYFVLVFLVLAVFTHVTLC